MSKKLQSAVLSALVLLTVPAARAEQETSSLHTKIFKLVDPSAQVKEAQVFSTRDGRVYFASPSNTALMNQLREARATGLPLNLVVDKDEETLIDAQPLSNSEAAQYSDDFERSDEGTEVADDEAVSIAGQDGMGAFSDPAMPRAYNSAIALGYTPTVLSSQAEADMLFSNQKILSGRSECYRRAHVWANEFRVGGRQIKSMKVFMFFTETFRQRFTTRRVFRTRPYKWWFHVSPYVYVNNQEVTLDKQFLDGAVSMADWIYEFIGKVPHDNAVPNPTRAQAVCLDADRYSQYSKERNSAYCVTRKVPMYYFQPLDVEALDCQPGSTPTSCKRTILNGFRQGDLDISYSRT